MSKYITITPDFMAECRAAFEEALRIVKMSDGKMSFTKTFTGRTEKAKVIFKPVAWTKMLWLIRNFDKEVAWHGIAYRGQDESRHEYYITDILVYPQEVTGATVNTDQEKYQTWLYGLEDEQFNNMRMQGHSHVNMGVSPSSVDLTHQAKILEQLEDDMFYIFMIYNKSLQRTVKIYDMKKNILFEDSDVAVEVEGDSSLTEFEKTAREMVVNKTYTPGVSYNGSAAKPAAAASSTIKKPAEESKKTRVKAEAAENTKKDADKDYSRTSCYGYGYGSCSSGGYRSHSAYYGDDDEDWRSPFYASDNYYGGCD